MYKKNESVWLKHFDFFLLDIIGMQIAYVAAFIMRHGIMLPYANPRYRDIAIFLVLVQICVNFFMEMYKNILRRGYFKELKNVIVNVTVVVMIVFTYLFVTKTSSIYSRAVFLQMWGIGIIILFAERIFWKSVVRKRMRDARYLSSLIVISSSGRVEDTVSVMLNRKYTGFYIKGIILENVSGRTAESIHDIPVVSRTGDSLRYLKENVVDEVFLDLPEGEKRTEYIRACEDMGITLHINLGKASGYQQHAIVEKLADHLVITTSIRVAAPRQLFLKRAMDIAGGITGIILTVLLTVIFGPIIFIQSPGPIFFSQIRVGRNGRKFRIYKFRSMYPDAEERKKELMEKNKMKGLMFKMDNDPRIIPIGRFMRKTSLDEFPQFFNVLKGDMSLVGTRPPTVDEYEQYEMHHKARLAAKPGLTGMWQVSGRSDIVDFEEVVRLDTEYIENWNIGLDCKILWQTVKAVATGKGSV